MVAVNASWNENRSNKFGIACEKREQNSTPSATSLLQKKVPKIK